MGNFDSGIRLIQSPVKYQKKLKCGAVIRGRGGNLWLACAGEIAGQEMWGKHAYVLATEPGWTGLPSHSTPRDFVDQNSVSR